MDITNIPEFSYINPESIKKGTGDAIVKKTWNVESAKDAILSYIIYEASAINESIKNKITGATTEFSLKNMVTFLSKNHNVGGYDDSEFDKINKDALKQISDMRLVDLIGANMPEESETDDKEGYFDDKTKERLGKHLSYAEQHDEMIIVMKKVGDGLENVRTSSLDKIKQFTVGNLMDERKTNLDFITFFDIFNEDFVEYFGELLPVYTYTIKDRDDRLKDIQEEIEKYLKGFKDADQKKAIAIRGLSKGVSDYMQMVIGDYISGMFDVQNLGTVEERLTEAGLKVDEGIYDYRTMTSMKISPTEITVIQNQLLPLGEGNARRQAEEIFGTDSVIQTSLEGEGIASVSSFGFDPAQDYKGKNSVEINLEAMSQEEWDRLLVTLIEYGGQGRSRSLQGKAKLIVMDAVETFIQEKKAEIFGSLPEFTDFDNMLTSKIESIYEAAKSRKMVSPKQRDEDDIGESESIYLSPEDLLEYFNQLLTSGNLTVIPLKGKKGYKLETNEYNPYTAKYGESVRKLESRVKNVVKFSPKSISFEEEGRQVREKANTPIAQLREILDKTDASFSKQMRKMHSQVKSNLSGDFNKLLGFIQIFTDENEDEAFDEESFSNIDFNINEINDSYVPFVEFMVNVGELIDDRQQFVNTMKQLALDEDKLEVIVDSFSLMINEIGNKIEQDSQGNVGEVQEEEESDEEFSERQREREEFDDQSTAGFGSIADTFRDSLYNIFQGIVFNELMNPNYEQVGKDKLLNLLQKATESDTNKAGIPKESIDGIIKILEEVEYIVDNLDDVKKKAIKAFLPKVTIAEGVSSVRAEQEEEIQLVFKALSETMAGSKLGDVTTYGNLRLDVTITDNSFTFSGEYKILGNVRPQIARTYISYGKDSRDTTTAAGYKVANLRGGTMIEKALLESLEQIRIAINTVGQAI